MPSTYAHYRFGCRVYHELPEDLKSIVDRHRGNYDIGQHGPDILFYYKPLSSNSIKEQGYSLHKEKGSRLFTKYAGIMRENKGDEALKSYLIGFVCHYVLDSHCHSYIENKIRISGVDHNSIESSFERALLIADGRTPGRETTASHLNPGDEISMAASKIFDNVTPEDVNKAISSFHFYDDLLSNLNPMVRGFVTAALKITGQYEGMKGRLLPKNENPDTRDSDLRLIKLFDKAVQDARGMIDTFMNAVKTGDPVDDPAFGGSFGPWTGWEDIPVYTFEEEQNYEV